jgi:hypothetical protein
MIQAIPIWLSRLNPSFIPTQEQLTSGGYDTALSTAQQVVQMLSP